MQCWWVSWHFFAHTKKCIINHNLPHKKSEKHYASRFSYSVLQSGLLNAAEEEAHVVGGVEEHGAPHAFIAF